MRIRGLEPLVSSDRDLQKEAIRLFADQTAILKQILGCR